MDPFRHCHRNAYQGLAQSAFILVSASSIPNRCFLLGELPRNYASFLFAYPENRTSRLPTSCFTSSILTWSLLLSSLDQVLDRLVSASFIRYRTFTADLSPGRLPGVLLLSNGTLLLEVGFTLRCLQRLSHPHFASQLCRWHDNCCTSDASTPVLSY